MTYAKSHAGAEMTEDAKRQDILKRHRSFLDSDGGTSFRPTKRYRVTLEYSLSMLDNQIRLFLQTGQGNSNPVPGLYCWSERKIKIS